MNAEGVLTGDLDMYLGKFTTTSSDLQMIQNDLFITKILDSNFTSELTEPIGNGNSIYAQSELMPEAEAIADLQLVTCVSAPGPIENMAPTGSVSQFDGHHGAFLGIPGQLKCRECVIIEIGKTRIRSRFATMEIYQRWMYS